jgi:tetratricopeptide (TPR) repeat protein
MVELKAQQVSTQHQVSDFLQAELLHTLGAYRLAADKLGELRKGIGDRRADTTLREVVDAAQGCNEHLRDALHRPSASNAESQERRRHPSPYNERPDPLWPDLLLRVSDFYSVAATALSLHLEMKTGRRQGGTGGHKLGSLLAVIHDPQRRGVVSKETEESLIRGRLHRTLYRLEEVNKLLPETLRPPQPTSETLHGSGEARAFREILDDHMGADSSFTALHLTVLEALSDAHMSMHEAEHVRSQSFGTMFTRIPETHAEMQTALRRSVVLNTFVYAVGRSMPWVFAEDENERDYVVNEYEKCCETLTPTYCMWIGNQLSLLALHRRAYTWWTLGDRDRAYRDFYKLTRFLRDLRQRIEQRAVRVPGTKTLIEGLSGIAEHHIGRIYRGQHAHRVALRYFDRASLHLKGWEQHDEIGGVLRNSRWRLNLLISQGKANYELGRVKKSLLYYARAWRAFLLLAESESHSTANIDVVTQVIKWLASVEDDPELSKAELSRRLEPLVKQFETVYSPVHLRLLAADIMMRLGHLLFILKLPPIKWVSTLNPNKLPPAPDHALAHRCLLQAAALDPASTLIAADLLKIRHNAPGARWPGLPKKDPAPASLDEQWPSGGGRFEAAARIIEYILQEWLATPPTTASESCPGSSEPDGERRQIARELLGSFLDHTDSSNVKLAQVYRYLMQETHGRAGDTAAVSPTIDIVCLRRYSSFFPFLPRPAAFRAPGGGYLVQVRESLETAKREGKEDAKPFGVAVDPGADFLDNLYRCGYSLADIHMVVLTHDHADHIASLDALLALMGIRMILGDKTFSDDRRLTIVGNESVVKRYEFFNDLHPVRKNTKGEAEKRRDAVKVMDFEEFYRISRLKGAQRFDEVKEAKILLEPASLCIEPIQTIDHYDATGYVSQGFLLSMGTRQNRSSVLFTGDTGPAPGRLDGGLEADGHRHYLAHGTKSLRDAAASADVVVAHLSSVPLRELRQLAGLTGGEDKTTARFAELWKEAVLATERAEGSGAQKCDDGNAMQGADETRFLLQQLQFAFRSLSAEAPHDDLSVSPLSPIEKIKEQSEKHLYLSGLLDLAEHMARSRPSEKPPLLLIGELREELGTFRTRIASRVTEAVFERHAKRGSSVAKGPDTERVSGTALTADIGLRVRLSRPGAGSSERSRSAVGRERRLLEASVLCTTCDLDNDLIATERFHAPRYIREVCVKGENEGVFYNCLLHDPGKQPEQVWVESVERFDVFGD